jgi:hypothetical protein
VNFSDPTGAYVTDPLTSCSSTYACGEGGASGGPSTISVVFGNEEFIFITDPVVDEEEQIEEPINVDSGPSSGLTPGGGISVNLGAGGGGRGGRGNEFGDYPAKSGGSGSYSGGSSGGPYPVAPGMNAVRAPWSPVEQTVDASTDLLTDALAKIYNGISDIFGALHPGHATVFDSLRPGVRSVVSVTIHGVEFVVGLLVGGVPEIKALEAGGSAPVIVAGTNREMLAQALNHLKGVSGPAVGKAAVFENLASQISRHSGGSWNAARTVGADGSHIFAGDFGHAVIISPAGEVYLGNVTNFNQFSYGTAGIQPNYVNLKPVQ